MCGSFAKSKPPNLRQARCSIPAHIALEKALESTYFELKQQEGDLASTLVDAWQSLHGWTEHG